MDCVFYLGMVVGGENALGTWAPLANLRWWDQNNNNQMTHVYIRKNVLKKQSWLWIRILKQNNIMKGMDVTLFTNAKVSSKRGMYPLNCPSLLDGSILPITNTCENVAFNDEPTLFSPLCFCALCCKWWTRGKRMDSQDIGHPTPPRALYLGSTWVDTIIYNFSNSIFGFCCTIKCLLIFNTYIGTMNESKRNWWINKHSRMTMKHSWGLWGGRNIMSDWNTPTKKSSMFARFPTTSHFWALCLLMETIAFCFVATCVTSHTPLPLLTFMRFFWMNLGTTSSMTVSKQREETIAFERTRHSFHKKP